MSLYQIVGISAVTFLLFDVPWFLRTIVTNLAARLVRSKLKPLEESKVYSLCTTTDLDFMLHMSNAKYLREFDFGRFDFWIRSRLPYSLSPTAENYAVQHACTVRYRKSVSLLMPYVVRTRLVWWDERSLYFEQRLQTLHDGFTRAVGLCKSTIVNADVEEIVKRLFADARVAYCKPKLRQDLSNWLKFNELNSEFLRKETVMATDARSESQYLD